MNQAAPFRAASANARHRAIAVVFGVKTSQDIAFIDSSPMGESLDGIHSDYWRFYPEVIAARKAIKAGRDYVHLLISIDADAEINIETDTRTNFAAHNAVA